MLWTKFEVEWGKTVYNIYAQAVSYLGQNLRLSGAKLSATNMLRLYHASDEI